MLGIWDGKYPANSDKFTLNKKWSELGVEKYRANSDKFTLNKQCLEFGVEKYPTNSDKFVNKFLNVCSTNPL